jgi:hypothetical protein
VCERRTRLRHLDVVDFVDVEVHEVLVAVADSDFFDSVSRRLSWPRNLASWPVSLVGRGRADRRVAGLTARAISMVEVRCGYLVQHLLQSTDAVQQITDHVLSPRRAIERLQSLRPPAQCLVGIICIGNRGLKRWPRIILDE